MGIFLKGNSYDEIGSLIYQVPTFPNFIEELTPNPFQKQLVFSYFDNSKRQHILTSITVSLNDVLSPIIHQYLTNEMPYPVAPSVYYYKTNHLHKLFNAYDKEDIILNLGINPIYDISDVSFYNLSNNENKYKEYIGICLHFNQEEILHTILKVPTAHHDNIEICTKVFSERTTAQYNLGTSKKDFIDYSYFKSNLLKSNFFQEICYKISLSRRQKSICDIKAKNQVKKYMKQKLNTARIKSDFLSNKEVE